MTTRDVLRHAIEAREQSRARADRLHDDLEKADRLHAECNEELTAAEQARESAERRQASAIAQGLRTLGPGRGRTAFAPDSITARAEATWMDASYRLRLANRARDQVRADLEAAQADLRTKQIEASNAADVVVYAEMMPTAERLDQLVGALVTFANKTNGLAALRREERWPLPLRDIVQRLMGLMPMLDALQPQPIGAMEPRHGQHRRRLEAWHRALLIDPAADLDTIPLPDVLLMQPPAGPLIDPNRERLDELNAGLHRTDRGGLISVSKEGGTVFQMPESEVDASVRPAFEKLADAAQRLDDRQHPEKKQAREEAQRRMTDSGRKAG